MKLLGIDLEMGNPFTDEEGNDTKPENSWVTEVGLVMYDTDLKQVVDIYSALVNEGKGVSKDSEEYTGITTELITKYGQNPQKVANDTIDRIQFCDYVVAHNGNRADRPWIGHFFNRHLPPNWLKDMHPWAPPHWIDTMTDVEYPKNCSARSLTFLAGFHKTMNPFAHRAVTDVMTMFEVLNKYDINRVLKVSKSPEVTLRALSEVDSVQDYGARKAYFNEGTPEFLRMERWKKLVSKHGFRWDGKGKVWVNKTKQVFLDEGKVFPFDTCIVNNDGGPF